jgi:hypothetical protein
VLLAPYAPGHPLGSTRGPITASAMKRYRPPSKKSTAAEPRFWRVTIVRQRAEYVGIVEAPDERSAGAAAVREFKLSNEERRRLTLRARA